MRKTVSVLMAVVIIFSMAGCGKKTNSPTYEAFEWPVCGIAEMLPEPSSNMGKIWSASDTLVYMDISETSKDDFDTYVQLCKDYGFSESSYGSDDYVRIANEDGWSLTLHFMDDDVMSLKLSAPSTASDESSEEPDSSLDISEEESTEPDEVEETEPSEQPSETASQEPLDISEQTTEPAASTEPTEESDAVYYSTNSFEVAKRGKSGVFAYRHDDKSYDTYWIIDFDEGYAYTFTYGNDNSVCDKVEITSGDLNEYVVVTYHDGSSSFEYGLRFKRKNQPLNMVYMDGYGNDVDYVATDLKEALSIRDSMDIVEY